MITAPHEMAFSFLTTGPELSLQIPSEVSAVPQLTSPIVSGIGARTFAFTPDPADETLSAGMEAGGNLLRELSDRDGRPVQLFRRKADPPIWWLRWPLEGGCVTTHLREMDGGAERAGIVVANISISDERATPFLFLFPPLRLGVNSRPGYQEDATAWNWHASGEAGIGITIMRPGFLQEDVVVVDSSMGVARVRGGADGGIEVQVAAPSGLEEARAVLDLALQSLASG